MGIVVQNLYRVGNRWKFRKVIPEGLRPHTQSKITEFVRWLGEGTHASPEILKRHAAAAEECASLLEIARKRAEGRFDDISPEVVAHLIAVARNNILEEDEEDRFDESANELFASLHDQISELPSASPACLRCYTVAEVLRRA